MHGLMDPFNRGTFFENDKETYQDVLKLTNMRNREKVLQTGHALYMAADDDVLAILRFISSKKDDFGKPIYSVVRDARVGRTYFVGI